MTDAPARILLSWSSGKDCAWALHVLRQQATCDVIALLTTFNGEVDRVAMHGVRHELVEAQAAAAGLPLWSVHLPDPCSNLVYEERMRTVIERANAEGITHVAFGDLFLEDVRDYRIKMMEGTGIEPIFPIWGSTEDTPGLAQKMIDHGLQAVITCVDTKQLDASFSGQRYGTSFLKDLPEGVDPCGEQGEFHTFCCAGPMFNRDIPVDVGETVTRDGFCFSDVIPSVPEP